MITQIVPTQPRPVKGLGYPGGTVPAGHPVYEVLGEYLAGIDRPLTEAERAQAAQLGDVQRAAWAACHATEVQ